MSLLERHMAIIAAVSTVIYLSMFLIYVKFDINNGHYDLAFLLCLLVLLISVIVFTATFIKRELGEV